MNKIFLAITSSYVSTCFLKSYANCDKDLTDAVGNTPLIFLKCLSNETGRKIYAKAEFMNPTSSVKDRAAKYMIEEAELSGLLKPGGCIVEGTGGNTGVSLSQLGRIKGYQVVLTMPNVIGKEKVNYCKRFGAVVYLQPLVPFTDPNNYARFAETLASTINGVHLNQFENLANFRAHFHGTGPEIWNQTQGKVDGFVTSAGTGGTLAGISAYLKDMKPSVRCFLVDPSGSCLYSFVTSGELESAGSSFIEGIGIGRVTANFKQAKVDGAYRVSDRQAVEMAFYLQRNEGLFVGPSAALNLVGAVRLARSLPPGSTIVSVLCDGGERYLSSLYDDGWLAHRELLPRSQGRDLAFVDAD